mmetsp:Transcript_30007/g.97867  ORF Transcript_30007/g.97867 Transcript_30007/m.97867 type:complete len:255 (-) Transcript_30007:120-884(-)
MGASGWPGGGWTARAQEQLYSLLRREAEREAAGAPSPVVALLFGHLHTGSVRLLPPFERSSAGQEAVSRSPSPTPPASAGRWSQPRGGRWRMPVVYLSPSLTPRNPTPHAPAVRLYEVGKAAVSGAASGAGARQPPLQVVDILEHSFDVDRSNARGAEQWGVRSLRQAHNVSSFDYGAWRAWAARLLADDAAFGRLFRPQRCADEIDAAYGVCKASFLCAALQPEVASYAACLRRVRSAAVPPPGWSPAQKRTP